MPVRCQRGGTFVFQSPDGSDDAVYPMTDYHRITHQTLIQQHGYRVRKTKEQADHGTVVKINREQVTHKNVLKNFVVSLTPDHGIVAS